MSEERKYAVKISRMIPKSLGSSGKRTHYRGYVKNKEISDLGEIIAIWETAELPKGSSTGAKEIVHVTFPTVTCSSVGSFIGGHLGRVILIDPKDPIHSKLFHFELQVDISERGGSIEVRTAQNHLNLDLFMRVLQICQREFYQKGEMVRFSSRKYVGRTKRRYLLWLDREGEYPNDQVAALARHERQKMTRKNMDIGKLRNAGSVWESFVRTEQALQRGI